MEIVCVLFILAADVVFARRDRGESTDGTRAQMAPAVLYQVRPDQKKAAER